MPADPHTWAAGDFVTASLLNGDLYWSNGQMFTPNGIRFHARRPIYRSYDATPGAVNILASNTWGFAYGFPGNVTPEAGVIVDTPGQFGAWFDPNQSGNIRLNHLNAGGGASTSNGGLMLATSFCLWGPTSNAPNLGCGIGDSSNSTTAPGSWGTLQGTNSAHQVCCFCMDLLDSNALRYANLAFNGSSAALAPNGAANTDGSGWSSRFMAHWASVYPANGHTVTNAPAPLTSWTGQTITPALLNGNTGLRDVLRFYNMPPLLRAQATSTQSLTSGVAATANLSATSGMNSYSAFSSNTFTAPFAGLYLVHCYASVGNISSPFRVGVMVNGGTTIWGPFTPGASAGSVTGTKTQILSLNAGDTLAMRMQANAAATTNGTFGQPRMICLYVGAQGAPSLTPITAPDTTFRWAAGQQGPLDPIFNAHVANDLNLLNQRPYLLTYQTVAQSITPGTATALSMDTVAGQVHGDAGDPWSGWNSSTNTYTAPIAGWYMAVEEVSLAAATLTSTPSVLALLQLNPHGSDTWDRYQQQNMTTSTGGGGATAVSYYYLRAGDTIGPGIQTYDSSSTTINTGTSTNSHFELVWLGEG